AGCANPGAMQTVVLGCGDHNRPQIEIGVCYVDCQNSRRFVKVPKVDGKSFARKQVNGNRIANERVQNKYIEGLKVVAAGFALERQTGVAGNDLNARRRIREECEIRRIGSDRDNLRMDFGKK